MAIYTPESERGAWREGIRVNNLSDVNFDSLVGAVKAEVESRGIPASFETNEYVSGKFFSKTKAPLLLIRNNQPGCKYFTLGIYINQNVLMFPLFGESAENTKANKHEYYKTQGTGLKAALYKPDMLKLQQENMWQEDICACVDAMFE